MGEWLEVRREPCDKLTMLFIPRGFLARSPLRRVFLRDVGWARGPAGSGGQRGEVTDAPFLQLNLVAQARWAAKATVVTQVTHTEICISAFAGNKYTAWSSRVRDP